MDLDSEMSEGEDFHPSSLLEVVVKEEDASESEYKNAYFPPLSGESSAAMYQYKSIEPGVMHTFSVVQQEQKKASYWRVCSICKFREIGGKESTFSYHKFPTDEYLCNQWKKVCNLRDTDDTTNLKVCSRHFMEDDFLDHRAKSWGGALKLKAGAVPSLCIPDIQSSSSKQFHEAGPGQQETLGTTMAPHASTGSCAGTNQPSGLALTRKENIMPGLIKQDPDDYSRFRVSPDGISSKSNKTDQEVPVTRVDNMYWRSCYLCKCGHASSSVSYHKFPSDEKACKLWKQVCNLTDRDNVSTLKLCSKHFHSEDYRNGREKNAGGKFRLKPGTVPSIDVPNPLSSKAAPTKYFILSNIGGQNSSLNSIQPGRVLNLLFRDPSTGAIVNPGVPLRTTVMMPNGKNPIPVCTSAPKLILSKQASLEKPKEASQKSSVAKQSSPSPLTLQNAKHIGQPRVVIKRLNMADINKFQKGLITDEQLTKGLKIKEEPHEKEPDVQDRSDKEVDCDPENHNSLDSVKSEGNQKSVPRGRTNWYRYCYLCEKIVDKEGTASLHKFPANPDLCNQWVKICNLTDRDDVSGVRICSQHFKPEDISEPRVKSRGVMFKLKTGAIPCINVPNPPEDTETSNTFQIKTEPQDEFHPSNLLEVVNESSPGINSVGSETKKQAADLGKTKKYGRCCFLCGYKEEIGIQSTIIMHRFPYNEQVNRLWKQACNLFEHDYMNTSSLLICSNHFVATDYMDVSKIPGCLRMLKPGAVPSISVPNPSRAMSLGSFGSVEQEYVGGSDEINPIDIMEVTFDEPGSFVKQNVNSVNPVAGNIIDNIIDHIYDESNSSVKSQSLLKTILKPPESPPPSQQNLSGYSKGTKIVKNADVNVLIRNVCGPTTSSVSKGPLNMLQISEKIVQNADVNKVIRDVHGPTTSSVSKGPLNMPQISEKIVQNADVNMVIRDVHGPTTSSVSKGPLNMPQISEELSTKIQQIVENIARKNPGLPGNSLNWQQPVKFVTTNSGGQNIHMMPPVKLTMAPPGLFLQTQALKKSGQVTDNSSQTLAPAQQVEQSCQTDAEADEDEDMTDEVLELDDVMPPVTKKRCISLSLAESSASESTGPKQMAKGAHLKRLRDSHMAEEQMKRIKQRINSLDDLLCHLQKRDLLSKDAADVLMNTASEEHNDLHDIILKKLQARGSGAWGLEMKTFALTLRFFSLDAYNYVNNLWPNLVPHVSEIKHWFSRGNANPGFSQEALDAIYLQSAGRNEGILCNIMISEMTLQQQMVFENNRFYGGVDMGTGQKMQCDSGFEAQSALIFFVTALDGSWSIPIGYFLIKSLNAKERANLLGICLELLHEACVKVISITLDGSLVNTSMCCHLGANFSYGERFQPWFLNPVTREKIFVFYDACCMMKLVRDALGDRNIILDSENKYIKWAYIKKLGKVQSELPWEVDTKLTETHIMYQNKRTDMKLCLQTLSRSVYKAFMCVLEKNMENFDGCYSTAVYCLMFNNIFDMLNCRNRFSKKKYRVPIDEDSIMSLRQSASVFIKYILGLKDNYGAPMVKTFRKTGFLGFIVSLTNIFELYEMGKSLGLKHLLTHKLSLDHVRVFFNVMHNSNEGSGYLNAKKFEWMYRKLILKCGMNFENLDYLVNGINFLRVSSRMENFTDPICDYKNHIHVEGVDHECFNAVLSLKPIIGDVIKYMSGFVVSKILSQRFCLVCAEHLTDIQNIQMLLKKENQRKYIVPSVDVCRICKIAEIVLQENRALSVTRLDIRFLVLKTLERIGGMVFDTTKMKAHILEQGIFDNHLTQLYHLVIETFLGMRMLQDSGA